MNDTVPYIISCAYKDQIDQACKSLSKLGLKYLVMYVIFNDGSRFVLSNIYQLLVPYYKEELYKEDFHCAPDIISKGDFICDTTQAVSEHFREILEKRFNVHRNYYIVRRCPECTFIFGAIKNKKVESCVEVYKNTMEDFEHFCANFLDQLVEIIRAHSPKYKNSFILTNARLRRSVITRNNTKKEKLSKREIECLWWASQGKSTKEVARMLSLSPTTVETHNKHIREKLRCSTMIEAVVEGIQRGIIGNINPYHSIPIEPGSEYRVERNNLVLLNNDAYLGIVTKQ